MIAREGGMGNRRARGRGKYRGGRKGDGMRGRWIGGEGPRRARGGKEGRMEERKKLVCG